MSSHQSLRSSSKRPLESENVTESVTSDVATPTTVSKKRKVDWATVDQEGDFRGFTLHPAKIKAPPKNKKQKTRKSIGGDTTGVDVVGSNNNAPQGAEIVQKNPFSDGHLSETHYLVKPAAEWASTKRYRMFTIGDAEFEVGQTIFVNKTPEELDATSAIQHWIGKVLEVRAGDAAHVFLRVYWLYRPEEVPGGRQWYHADSELIASNHMDIIEAATVQDRATVVHWDEDLEKPMPLKDEMFWRQTFDIGKPKGKQLSKLRVMCVDQKPCNPDEGVVQCSSCSAWLHTRCLEEQAVADAQAVNKKKGSRKSSKAVVDFSANLTTTSESGPTYLTVTDHRSKNENKRFNVDIKCLICNALIEGAADGFPSETVASDSKLPSSREAIPAEPEEEDSVLGHEDESAGPVSPAAESVKRGPGRPRKHTRPIVQAPAKLVDIDVLETTVKPVQQTPTAAPVSESVFQSGFRSVKKMLWPI